MAQFGEQLKHRQMTCAASYTPVEYNGMCTNWRNCYINKFAWWREWKWIKHIAVFFSFVLFSVTVELGLRCLAVTHTSVCAILSYVRTAGCQQTSLTTGSKWIKMCRCERLVLEEAVVQCGITNTPFTPGIKTRSASSFVIQMINGPAFVFTSSIFNALMLSSLRSRPPEQNLHLSKFTLWKITAFCWLIR